jgi:WD40 repeat protein
MNRRPSLVASLFAFAALVAVPESAAAQGGTDIWVAPFSDIAGRVSVGRPMNVTRRAGYDNQPAFTPDGSTILFTSTRGDGQADIWRVPVTGGAQVRVTKSDPESEYSATPMPGQDGFSAIRVERDSTQRLWSFNYDGTGAALVLRALRPVGYHVWIGDATLGTFVLSSPPGSRSPNALVLVDPRTEKADTLAREIGRALVRVPGRDAFTFLQVGKDTSWISEVDVRTKTIRRIAPSPVGSDYHLWTPSGQLIASVGTGLMIRVGDRWDVLADFAELGVKDVSRLALSPRGDRLAFVVADRP